VGQKFVSSPRPKNRLELKEEHSAFYSSPPTMDYLESDHAL
jgi:hypothetical protein